MWSWPRPALSGASFSTRGRPAWLRTMSGFRRGWRSPSWPPWPGRSPAFTARIPWPGRSCPASSTGGTSTVWPGCCPAGGSPWAGRPTRRACASPPRCWWTCRRAARCWRRRSSAPSCLCCPTGACRSWWRPRGRSPARWPSTCSPGAAPSSGRCWRPCPSGAGASTTRWCTWPTPASPSAGWGTAAWAPATAKRASTPSPTKRAY